MPSPTPGSIRRARHLVGYWHEGELVVHNYATEVSVAVDPALAAVLHYFADWRSPAGRAT